jgi:ATP-binding cassette, subfamily B, bacterial MsbA
MHTMRFSILLRRFKYICTLIIKTPHFGWIISLQVLSSFFTVLGMPLLIPVLEYAKNDVPGDKNLASLDLFGKVFNTLGFDPSFLSLLFFASLLIASGQMLVFTSTIVANFSQQRLSMEYRKRIFRSYSTVDWLWITMDRSGEMNHSILREADGAGVAHLNAQRIVIYLIQVAVFMFIAVKLSFIASMLAVVLYGVLFFINAWNSRHVRNLSEKFNETFKKIANATVNLLQNKKFFKSSMLLDAFLTKVFQYVDETVRVKKLTILREQLQNLWTYLVTFLFIIFLMGFRNILNLSFTELLVVLLVFMRLGPHFNSLFKAYFDLNIQVPAHQSIERRLNDLEENKEVMGTEVFHHDKPISFSKVSFKYPKGKQVINEISLEIKPFQSVAFVGSSGAGKSTILDLILGLLKPDSGKIYYGDIPYDRLDTGSFRKDIAYVSQEATLLDGTLLENLAIGCKDVNDDIVTDICKRIHIDRLISELPEGIHTEIGENGIRLSGGQKEMVALARALIMKPKILILDEATSELDSETEQLMQEAIKWYCHEMTIIMVAHRLSTVRFADKIFVIEKGVICETGKYDELLKKKGRLHYLDSLQKGSHAVEA